MRQACRPTQTGHSHGADIQQGVKGPPPRGLWGQQVEASERVLLPVKGQWRHGPTLRVKGMEGWGLVDSSHRADALGGPGRGQAHPAHPRYVHLRLEANGLARSPEEKTGRLRQGAQSDQTRPTRMQNIIKWLHNTRSRSASALRVKARCLKQGDALPAGKSEEAARNRSNLTRVPGKVWACEVRTEVF